MRALIRVFPIAVVLGAVAFYAAHKRAEAVEAKSLSAVVQSGDCADDELRMAALDAVLQMESDGAMPILLKVLERRDACSEGLRSKAVFLLSQQDVSEADDVLVTVVKEDPSFEVRKQAVFWLSQVSGDRAVLALEWVLEESGDRELQEQAIFALSQHSSRRSEEILRDYAGRSGEPINLRENAIFWLGNEGSAESHEYLRGLFTTVSSEQLQEKIIFAVSQQSATQSRDWLLTVVRDDGQSIDIRKHALFWLGQEQDIGPADLDGLYSNSADRELREQVLFVLSQRSETWAVEQLISIARSESDPDLRKNTLFWLGQSNDPKAAEFLLEVIEK
jgi:HEAT repeat protein